MSKNATNEISLMSLYQVGAQRGNRKSRLNPRLKNAVYGFNKGICLIDLVKTQNSMGECASLLQRLGQKKKQVLIVGTSKHLKEEIQNFAKQFGDSGMPFVNSRWLGGTISNWSTIKKTLKTLEKLEKIEENKEFFGKLSKNEQLNILRKKEKINKFFEGLVNLKNSRPGALIVLDAAENPIAIREADSMGIPVIALTNTSSTTLPQSLKYTIVSNVHSLKAVQLIMSHLVEAYNNGFNSEPPVVREQTQPEA
jgi:small subunit ribosomal protein S2